MNDTAFIFTNQDINLFCVALISISIGLLIGWIKGYEDGLAGSEDNK